LENDDVSPILSFRGGTALHELFFAERGRHSEDIDLAQMAAAVVCVDRGSIRLVRGRGEQPPVGMAPWHGTRAKPLSPKEFELSNLAF
jgi:hypothetical protein